MCQANHFGSGLRLFSIVSYFRLPSGFLLNCAIAIILRKQINRDFRQLAQIFSSDQTQKQGHIQQLQMTYRLLLAKAFVIGCASLCLVGIAIGPAVGAIFSCSA